MWLNDIAAIPCTIKSVFIERTPIYAYVQLSEMDAATSFGYDSTVRVSKIIFKSRSGQRVSGPVSFHNQPVWELSIPYYGHLVCFICIYSHNFVYNTVLSDI